MEHAAEWVKVGDLAPWADNPRQNDNAVAEVAASIKRFGFGAPIIARRADKMVIAGHTRLKAAVSLGLDTVPVRYMDLDPVNAQLLALADNKLNERAGWDDDQLAEVMRSMDATDLEGLGWDSDEIQTIIDDGPDEPSENEFMLQDQDPDAPIHSKPGEVYELGPHKLICGDCRDSQVIADLLGAEKINVAITSPPYASQRKYDEDSGFKPIRPDAYVEWFANVQANVRDHLAEDGSWFVNIKEHCEDGQRVLYVKDLVIAHVRDWRWHFVDELVWTHNGTPKAPLQRFKNGFEPIYQFASGRHKFRPKSVRREAARRYSLDWAGGHPNDEEIQKYGCSEGMKRKKQSFSGNSSSVQGQPGSGQAVARAIESKDINMAYPSNVLTVGKNREALGHSAAYPIALPAFFIKAYSDPLDIIFDPFLGSGTSLISAAMEGRICRGVEISPIYCDIIRRRWTRYATETGQDLGSGALDASE